MGSTRFIGLLILTAMMVVCRWLFYSVLVIFINSDTVKVIVAQHVETVHDVETIQHSIWSSWSTWSDCSDHQVCNSGSRVRSRKCTSTGRQECVGIYIENEDCPRTQCKGAEKRPIIDVMPATYSSFISQECDADIKYSYDHTKIPSHITNLYSKYPMTEKLKQGHFNWKSLPGNTLLNLQNMTKYCFEPHQLTLKEVTRVLSVNRTSRSSLCLSDYTYNENTSPQHNYIAGLSFVVDSKDNIVAWYFAVHSSKLGYRFVHYKRWKGQGFEEYL